MHEEKSEEFLRTTRAAKEMVERRLREDELDEDTRMYLRYHLALMKRALGDA
jgi:hypothetical protein